MIRFHVRGLVGDFPIRRRMPFVEAVCRERFDQFPYRFRFRFLYLAVFLAAGDEFFLLRLHLNGNLLAHGLAQVIRFKPRVSRKRDGNEQDVVLIGDDAVGAIKNVFHPRVEIRR